MSIHLYKAMFIIMYIIMVMTKVSGIAIGFYKIYANFHLDALVRPVAHPGNINIWKASKERKEHDRNRDSETG